MALGIKSPMELPWLHTKPMWLKSSPHEGCPFPFFEGFILLPASANTSGTLPGHLPKLRPSALLANEVGNRPTDTNEILPSGMIPVSFQDLLAHVAVPFS